MTHRGFTLLEALIAVSMVAVAVGAPLYGASRALVAANISKDKITASYLAQEGIECVRIARDNAFLREYPDGDPSMTWNPQFTGSNTYSNCRLGSGCTVDTVVNRTVGGDCSTAPVGGIAGVLYQNAAKQYTQVSAGNTITPFTRVVKIEEIAGGREVRAISTVSWIYKTTPYSVVLVNNLSAWK